MTPETQAIQNDDTSNPGMLWAKDGEALWTARAGGSEKSCADCHGDAATGMRGVAAHYPDYDAAEQRPVDLAQRINLCRSRHQQARPFAHESREMLALTALIGSNHADSDQAECGRRLEPFLTRGALFMQRQRQLQSRLQQLHDDNWDAPRRLRDHLAHPTGYPLYRPSGKSRLAAAEAAAAYGDALSPTTTAR